MKKIFAVLLMLVMVFSLAACGGSTEKNHDGEAETPSGSKIQQGRGYQEVVSDFEESGFTNIQLAPMGDLITDSTSPSFVNQPVISLLRWAT